MFRSKHCHGQSVLVCCPFLEVAFLPKIYLIQEPCHKYFSSLQELWLMSWSTNLWELGKGNNLFLQEPGAHKHHCNEMHCNHHHIYIVGSVQSCEYTSQFGSLEFFTSFLWIFSSYALQAAWGRPSWVARDELHAEDKSTPGHMSVIVIRS